MGEEGTSGAFNQTEVDLIVVRKGRIPSEHTLARGRALSLCTGRTRSILFRRKKGSPSMNVGTSRREGGESQDWTPVPDGGARGRRLRSCTVT